MYKDEFYADWDEDCGMWCVFGTETGKCYGTFSDEREANEMVEQREETIKFINSGKS